MPEAVPPDPGMPGPDPGHAPGVPPPRGGGWRGWHLRRGPPVLYPNAYVWLVLVSSLDIMVTWVILHQGGREENPLARSVIEHFNLRGLVAFKFVLVTVFLLVCEFVGRRRPRTGRTMAYAAVGVSAAPVLVGVFLLATRL
jgi:hypothetical protein